MCRHTMVTDVPQPDLHFQSNNKATRKAVQLAFS